MSGYKNQIMCLIITIGHDGSKGKYLLKKTYLSQFKEQQNMLLQINLLFFMKHIFLHNFF